MSDLFEKKLFLSPAARRRGGKAGFALGRILSVIFFVIALGMFFGGLFFWLQKRRNAAAFAPGVLHPTGSGAGAVSYTHLDVYKRQILP